MAKSDNATATVAAAEDSVAVTFLRDRLVQDEHVGTEQETRFLKGKTYRMSRASADHWISRAVAVEGDSVPDGIVPVPDRGVITSVGGGWYVLPNGDRVRGRDAAEQALAALRNR